MRAMSSSGLFVLTFLLACAWAETAFPQYAPGQAASGNGSAAPAPPARAPGAFPPSPYGFQRGNVFVEPDSGQQSVVVGGYLRLSLFVFVLALFFLWAHSSKWVDEDSRVLKVRSEFW